MAKFNLASKLYSAARKVRDVEVILSLDPKKIVKRLIINKALGKSVVRKLMK